MAVALFVGVYWKWRSVPAATLVAVGIFTVSALSNIRFFWDLRQLRKNHPSLNYFLEVRDAEIHQEGANIEMGLKSSENTRRAKYYVLTDQRRKRLNSETREWGRQVTAIARILEAS